MWLERRLKQIRRMSNYLWGGAIVEVTNALRPSEGGDRKTDYLRRSRRERKGVTKGGAKMPQSLDPVPKSPTPKGPFLLMSLFSFFLFFNCRVSSLGRGTEV